MKIVSRQGDESGAEFTLGIVQKGDRLFVYFLPPGANKANLNEPHFVIAPGVMYGDLATQVDYFSSVIAKFVCPNFADSEELKQLRAELVELRRRMVSDEELEGLRADRVELQRLLAGKREIAELKARLVELEGAPDA